MTIQQRPPSGEQHGPQPSRGGIGLVLGAGGVLGGAWLVGALHALASETGWDPGSADYLVGTSAGAMIGGLLASGVPPWFMFAHSAGESVSAAVAESTSSPTRERADRSSRSGGATYRLHRGLPSIGPGSWRLALASLARPYRYTPAAVLAGWLPPGLISSEPLRETIGRVSGDGWADHPNLWIMACDYSTGRRVAFGREDSQRASLADAVAASCAIPGFYRPVEIGGRRYVDGGVASTSNLDVLADRGLGLVICLNPTSSLDSPQARSLGGRAAGMVRQASGRRLGREAKRVRAAGAEAILIQPTARDLEAMGPNLMSAKRRNQVIQVAMQSVAEHLQAPELREQLVDLPRGEPMLVRKPSGPLKDRLDFAQLAHARWAAAASS